MNEKCYINDYNIKAKINEWEGYPPKESILVISIFPMPNLSWIIYNWKKNISIIEKYLLHEQNKYMNVANLHNRSNATDSVVCSGNHIKLWCVFVLINSHDKHGSIFTAITYNDLLGSTLSQSKISNFLDYFSHIYVKHFKHYFF